MPTNSTFLSISSNVKTPLILSLLSLLCFAFSAVEPPAHAEELTALSAAINSIRSEELQRHIETLADDSFEGREAGSRGGRAACSYLVRYFEKFELEGMGDDESYFQSFGEGYRNILGLLPGSDPVLKNEIIVISGHYDHVGYGTKRDSFGPVGYIHNGADDNASGAAGVIEAIEAFSQLDEPPKRSILFALWDAEEKGLLGSKHWVNHPTVGLNQVKLMFNLDMIGRLAKEGLHVYGIRSAAGLRRTVSNHNEEALKIAFKWKMKSDSDHYSFYKKSIPVLLFHTGLHDNYHRPSDDAELINSEGTQQIARLVFQIAHTLAQAEEVPVFRHASANEYTSSQSNFERPDKPMASRLGIELEETQKGAIRVKGFKSGFQRPRQGLQIGDLIHLVDMQEVESSQQVVGMAWRATRELSLAVQRRNEDDLRLFTTKLRGNPLRVGVSWRQDNADRSLFFVTSVAKGSPADLAGILVGDRIYQVNQHMYSTSAGLMQLLSQQPGPFEFKIEREGKIRTFNVEPGTPLTQPATE